MRHVTFLAIALAFGIAYAVLTPPFEVPDEVGHYFRASAAAYGTIRGTAHVPRGFKVLVYAGSMRSRGEHMDRDRVRLVRGVLLEPDARVPLDVAPLYSPAAYVPQLATAIASRVVRASPATGFYAGRIATLIASILVVILACRAAPAFAPLIECVALLPMSLVLFASWSADAMTIVAAFLATALLLRAIVVREPLTRGQTVAIACSIGWLSLCKPSYMLIGLLSLFLPRVSFRSAAACRRFRRHQDGGKPPYSEGYDRPGVTNTTVARSRVIALLLIVMLAGAATSVTLTMTTMASPRSDVPINSAEQVRSIAAHPAAFVRVLAHDLRTNGWQYLESMTGRLGPYETKLPLPVTIALLGLLALLGMTAAPPLATRVRLTIAAIAAAIVLGILTYLYVTSSIVGAETIDGTQGRYLLPILPAALAAVRVDRLRFRIPPSAIYAMLVVANAVAIRVLLLRYW